MRNAGKNVERGFGNTKTANGEVYMNYEVYEINRGSASFRLNSIELEIEIIIREMVKDAPMKKQDIQNKLSQKYNQSDVAHVIKHSKGIYCDINDIVHYREWVYADVEMVTGV